MVFYLFATGDRYLSDIVRKITKEGFTTAPMRPRRSKAEILAEDTDELTVIPKVSKIITPSNIQKILTHRFYIGQILGSDGAYVKVVVTNHLWEKIYSLRFKSY